MHSTEGYTASDHEKSSSIIKNTRRVNGLFRQIQLYASRDESSDSCENLQRLIFVGQLQGKLQTGGRVSQFVISPGPCSFLPPLGDSPLRTHDNHWGLPQCNPILPSMSSRTQDTSEIRQGSCSTDPPRTCSLQHTRQRQRSLPRLFAGTRRCTRCSFPAPDQCTTLNCLLLPAPLRMLGGTQCNETIQGCFHTTFCCCWHTV